MQGPAIHVDKLSLKLGNSHILSDMSFQVSTGSVHCLLGPNGGGKTSTLRCILGQMPHTGAIRIDWGDSRVIGYVPQLIEMERTLPLTIENFLTLIAQRRPAFGGLRSSRRGVIAQLLEKTGLADKRKFPLGSLSGGERQRLLFAQALLPSPALLLLDEPLTSMDEAGARIFADLIEELRQSGVTIIWVNHDLAQARRLADEATVVDHGAMATGPIESALSDQLLQNVFAGQGWRAGKADS